MKKSLKNILFKGYEQDMNFVDQRRLVMAKMGIPFTTPYVPKKKTHTLPIVLGVTLGAPLVLVGAIAITIVATNRRDVTSFNSKKFDFSIEEKAQVASQSFAPLNKVTYPSSTISSISVSDEYKDSVTSFASKLYTALDDRNTNTCYSPLSLYAGLDILSEGASEEATSELDSVLGLTKEKRKAQWNNMYKANYYSSSSGTTQMHNGFFLTNDYGMTISDDYLKELTSRYVEAYSLNFHNEDDVSKMLSWVDSKTKATGFVSKDSLNIFPASDTTNINIFYLFSTLYFQANWKSTYDGDRTVQDLFYKADGSSVTTKYLRHTTDTIYHEYTDYVSCMDYYFNGTSIEYFVPKKVEDSIFTILEDKDFLNEDSSTATTGYVSLSLPKFSYDVNTDFSSTLNKIGLSSLSSSNKKPFNNILKTNPYNYSAYLGYVKQRNIVSFTEEGTTIKTGSVFAGFGAGSAAHESYGYDVKLNQPFVYVIRDSNNLPLYVGQFVSPN
jgi:serine protease inhibitor